MGYSGLLWGFVAPSRIIARQARVEASIRKKTSLYSKAKRTNKADLWAKYKLCKQQTQRAIRSTKWSFKKKSKLQDGNGVSPLKANASCIQIVDVSPKY